MRIFRRKSDNLALHALKTRINIKKTIYIAIANKIIKINIKQPPTIMIYVRLFKDSLIKDDNSIIINRLIV